ncbi:unnamed protein product [Nezara viridula]|uniref:Gustatory receptor n=1 Tax=Nezara viridula TaxID=85310 RepID=A0A9P0MP06_NEZVI|nr:unnamed protein product [Nezara viridula]
MDMHSMPPIVQYLLEKNWMGQGIHDLFVDLEHILSNTQFLLTAEANADRLRKFLDDGNLTTVVGYSLWLAFFTYAVDFLFTLIWNYTDIFLTAISLSLANMFKQFNKDLRMTAINVSNENTVSYWRKKRELYNKLSLFAKTVDDKISHLVLISFAVNLYFICIQLLHSIQPLTSLLRVAYFCGSFGHILFRTCSVCFAATSIYEHSKGSLSVLYSVPPEQFNSEDNALFYWRKKRELYNRLSQLAMSVEDKMSGLVLISFATNLYFICIQLLNSIQPLESFLRVAYFCGSFGHLLFRTISVCFAATSIYEHSKESLPILYSVPPEQFNREVQRLIHQMTSETLALTGCKFFTVTRSLMLTIAGTIVTYEVVLVQFSGKSDESAK